MLDGIVRHRGIARSAIGVLTIGLSALGLLAVQTNNRTAETTTHVRASLEVSDQWDEVSFRLAGESEALADYLLADTDIGRRPLSSALGSAAPTLDRLEGSDDPTQTEPARAIGARTRDTPNR